MCFTVDGDHLVGASGVQQVLHHALGSPHQLLVVVALGVGEVRHRQPVAVLLLGQGDPVAGLGQKLAQRAQAGPVHVVTHVLAQNCAPVPLGRNVFRPGDRQRGYGLDGEAALVVLAGVGLVELLAAHLRRRCLVHPYLGVEATRGLWRTLHHQVAAHLVIVVAQAVGEAFGRRVQQQPRCLDGVPGDGHPLRFLKVRYPPLM